MQAALRVGYYDVPREATTADVADEVGCATATASTISGTAAAQRAYRLGYTRYREARRQLSDALATVEDGSWRSLAVGSTVPRRIRGHVEEFTTAYAKRTTTC